MARKDFVSQLQEMGYEVEELGGDKLAFAYTIPVGPRAGQQVRLGFIVSDAFPANPPSGPHVSPRLLPVNPAQAPHPNGGIHESREFGADWEYWSRPFPDWGRTDHTVSTYMAHIRHLFDTL